ncbi:MAG: cation:proton antiporter [Candidatus Woesearchaeota archaeon]
MIENHIFVNLGIIIVIATAFGYIARMLKQPLIPVYILTGVILGPVLQVITDYSMIRLFSEIGIAFLLFVVGLELDLRKIRKISFVSTFGSTIRMCAMFIIGLFAALILGFVFIESVYLGLVLIFASTMVVIKLLSDKHELDTLHGRIIIGFLLMEDLVAILILSALATMDSFTPLIFIYAMLKGILLIGIVILCSKFIFPALFKFAAKSQEFLLMLAISIMFFFSLLAFSLNFSIAIGAFVAGVGLASLPYNFEIIGRVTSLKDFFSIMFFVSLGLELVIGSLLRLIYPIFIFSLIIVVLKPIITIFIVSFFDYTKRTAFMTSINMGQISEFSLIIAMQGLFLGHIANDLFSFIVVLAIVTIGLTPYLSKYSNQFYNQLSSRMTIFERFGTRIREKEDKLKRYKFDVILIGCDRIGYNIIQTVKKIKKKVLVIDFNPDVVRSISKQRIPVMYGDIGDQEILDRIDFDKAQIVVSTAPSFDTNKHLVNYVKEKDPTTLVFITAYDMDDALSLYDSGADYVILPHFLGGHHASLILEDTTLDIKSLLSKKGEHIKELKKRLRLGHRHPGKQHD